MRSHNQAVGTPAVFSVKLLAVIVLYRLAPEDSVSFRTLQASAAAAPDEKLKLNVFFYDNTPGAARPPNLPNGMRYEAPGTNQGLAAAYNRALEIASAEGVDWLLTLDQDSGLPVDFLPGLADAINLVQSDPSIAAVVPQIAGEGRMLSPNYFLFQALPRFFPKGFIGIPSRETYAFNSASTLRVSALQLIGGYDPLFWLDNSDAYMYRRLHRNGKRVFVAGNLQVDHEFSMFDVKRRVSLDRYRSIVEAGCAFWDLELGLLAGLYHTASLVYRLYKHWKRGDDPEFRKMTLEILKRRLFQSRKQRIARWKADRERLSGAPAAEGLKAPSSL